ncbi:MAG: hypothetical protein ABT940_08195 [Alphaproteobacteria bacterium]
MEDFEFSTLGDTVGRSFRVSGFVSGGVLRDANFDATQYVRRNLARQLAEQILADRKFFSSTEVPGLRALRVNAEAIVLTREEWHRERLEAYLQGKRSSFDADPIVSEKLEVEDRMYSTEEVVAALSELCREVLDKTHPGWRDVVGLPDCDGNVPSSLPYRQWLDTQPEDYRYLVLNTYRPVVIGESIDKFREWLQCEEAFRE